MYPVSNAFLEAVKANNRKYYWTGRITTTAGTVYEFDQDDMVKGSGYITSQCCGSTEIELGTVYAAEMGISLFSEINRYTLEDAKVELFYHLQVAGGSYERIPMGIFEVSEANRKAKCLEIKAYDYMVRFEKAFTSLESIGNAYDFMVLCSTACDVTLAQDRATIEAMPNGTENLSIYSDNDIETYRDVLFYVGQVLGGFFVINRAGELELRKYGNTPVLTVERKHRFTSSFSDFITRYTAVSSTNLRTQIAEYYSLDPDDGLPMNLGVNPLLQFGLDETRRELCENILNDLSVVNYVPFDSDTIGNPALDVGDILSFTGGQADSTKYACITSNSIKIGGRQSIKCVGKNPKLSQAKSKNDKNISGLLAQIEAGKIGIHTFTNASAFTVRDVDTLTLEDTTVLQCSTFKFYGSYTPYGIFMDGGDGYWYGFSNQGNSSGSATVLWIKIKKSDYTFTEGQWTLSNATLMTMGSFRESSSYPSGNRSAVVRNGYLYVPSYDKTGIYKINISNSTDVMLISLGFTSAMRCIGETGSTDCCLTIINDIIVAYDFEIDVNDNVIATYAGEHCGNVSTPFFQYKEYVFAWGGAYLNQYRYTWILTPYLATICNLSQAVVKNADKTMKITYTLTEQTV